MAADLPDIKRQLDAFMAAAEHLHERDESGNLTRRAHDARSFLRSPLLDMRPYLRAKSAVDKARRKSKFKAETAISRALVEWVKWRQHELEYDLLLDKDDASKDVPKSREVNDREDKIRVTEKFIDELLERGVTPSDMSRKRQFEYDQIASLLRWSQHDPMMENADNPWAKLSAAGLLDAYRSGMTEDEARVIDLAMVLKDDRGDELLQAARNFLPETLNVSPGFASAAARMLERGRELTDGEARAYYDAFRHNNDQDISALGEALGITDPSDLIRVKAVNSFLSSADRHAPENMPMWLKVSTVRAVFDNADPASRAPSDWVPEVTARLALLANAFSESLSNEDAFDAVIRAGAETSVVGSHANRNSQERESLQAEVSDLRYLEALVMNGMSFKFSRNGCPIAETEPGFEDHPARTYRFTGDPRPTDYHYSEDDIADDEIALSAPPRRIPSSAIDPSQEAMNADISSPHFADGSDDKVSEEEGRGGATTPDDGNDLFAGFDSNVAGDGNDVLKPSGDSAKEPADEENAQDPDNLHDDPGKGSGRKISDAEPPASSSITAELGEVEFHDDNSEDAVKNRSSKSLVARQERMFPERIADIDDEDMI